MKNIIWQSRGEKWITDLAGMSERQEALQEPYPYIAGWCYFNFIKPKMYSTLLPPKAYDSSHLWNEFIMVTKAFPANYFHMAVSDAICLL